MVYPFVASVCSIVLAYIGGRLCAGGNRAGLIAAMLQAIIPIDVSMASQLNCDIPAALFLNTGVILAYIGSKAQTRKQEILAGVSAGVMLGISWLIRESAVFVMPFVAGYLIWVHLFERRVHLLILCLAAAMVFIVGMESLVYFTATGDPLFRLHAIREASRSGWSYDTAIFKNNTPVSLFGRLIIEGPRLIFTTPLFGGLTFLAGLATSFVVWCRHKGFGFVMFWYLSLLFLLNFGTTSLERYAPLILFPRYMYPLFFPSILLVGGWLAKVFPQVGEKTWVRERMFFFTMIIGYLVLKSSISYSAFIQTGRPSEVERKISFLLPKSSTVYTDSRTIRVLDFMKKYSNGMQFRDFEAIQTSKIPAGSRVLINPGRIYLMQMLHGYAPPECYTNIPVVWECEWRYNDAALYLIQ